MRVLLTGGTGFIGSHLAEELANQGHSVTCLARNGSHVQIIEHHHIRLEYGDVTLRETLPALLDGIDTVFHLAAALDARHLPEAAYWNTNVSGTENMLQASQDAGVRRFVHCSSVGVFAPSDHAVTEDEPFDPKPTTVYQRTKIEAEKLARAFQRNGRMPVTIVRPAAVVFGPRDYSNVLGLFRAIKDGRFMIVGHGHNKFHQIYVVELTRGIALAGTSERSAGQSYNLADRHPATMFEFASAIAESVGTKIPSLRLPTRIARVLALPIEIAAKTAGVEPPLSRARIDTMTMNREYDTFRAKNHLGFETNTGLRSAVRDTVEWYVSNRLL